MTSPRKSPRKKKPKVVKRADFDLAKRLPGTSQMERVKAARAMLDGTRQFSRRTEVAAFLAIFHPELSEKRKRAFLAAVSP